MIYCDYCPRGYGNCHRLDEYQRVSVSIKSVEDDLITAINNLYIDNYDLLGRELNERCITNHLFYYFVSEFKNKYKYYNIDAEYGKNGEGVKKYEYTYAYPDILIHKRDCNNENLVYMEIKCNKYNDERDKSKLAYFTTDFSNTNKKCNYHYKLGVGISLLKHNVEFVWYINGKIECVNTYKTGENGIVKRGV